MMASELIEDGSGQMSDFSKDARNYSSLLSCRVRYRRVRRKRGSSISAAGEGSSGSE